jgi:integrase
VPRKARDERLDNRTARLKLTPRREPYWRAIQQGRLIGYRRLAGGKGGTWIAQFYQKELTPPRQYVSLGTADDFLDADGFETTNFNQAQKKAGDWFADLMRLDGRKAEPLTVKEAVDHYMADYAGRGGKAVKDTKTAFEAHVIPALGDKEVAKLTAPTIRAWLRSVAEAPPRLRASKKPNAKPGKKAQKATAPDAMRARRASANRILTYLKAALNLAYREQRVPNDDAWRRVEPFKNVDQARIRYLSDEEAVRLINASDADFRDMVRAALVTGCRYGELAAARLQDLNLSAGHLHIPLTKSHKARAVTLTQEGRELFTRLAAGKVAADRLLVRTDGTTWGKSYQQRPLTEACKNGKIKPSITFHGLRHTHASRLAMAGTPMSVIAAQLGNSEAICAKHYAHLSPGYVSDTIRANFARFEPAPEEPASNVMPLKGMQ